MMRVFKRLYGIRAMVGLAAWLVFVTLAVAILPGAALAQVVSFNPSENVPTDPQFTVQLDIDCAGAQVKGVEVKIAFDPFLLRLDAVTPGTWFTGPAQAFYFFDYTGNDPQGTIHFASAVLEGSLGGTGPLAICHFTILDFGVSPLVFQDVDVRGLANNDLGFAHSSGDRIVIDPVVQVQRRAFGHLKAIYR